MNVHNEFNSSQTGGVKSLQNLKDKYNNEKKAAKAKLIANRKEIMKTGGGTAEMYAVDEGITFSDKQIFGLENKFDSDAIKGSENESVVEIEFLEETLDQTAQLALKRPQSSAATPKYYDKKMKMSAAKEVMIKSKTEGIDLDNKYKQLLIEKTELEKTKLQLEIEKLKQELNYQQKLNQ